MVDICHRAVICLEIQQEWNQHQSRISTKWRAAMNARKKLVKLDILAQQTRIAGRVHELQHLTADDRRALDKDVHLLAAAAQADRVLVTSDGKLKKLCETHLHEPLEWLLALVGDSGSQRQALLDRLAELAKSRYVLELS